jgi:hypothetical protein
MIATDTADVSRETRSASPALASRKASIQRGQSA